MILVETKESSTMHVNIGGVYDGTYSCPNCQKDLTLAASIPANLSSLLGLEVGKSIDLFCCWRCNLMLEDFVYSFGEEGYKVLNFNPGCECGAFYNEAYPDEFPELTVNLRNPNSHELGKLAELESMFNVDPIEYQIELRDLTASENLSLHTEEFFPLPNGVKLPFCPQCHSTEHVIACIPGTIGEADFTGNRFVFMLFIICNTCKKITCTHSVD